MRTSELTGAALDWAVAKCENADSYLTDEIALGGEVVLQWTEKFDAPLRHYTPSTDWAQGGPIIEREGIAIDFDGDDWCASTNTKPLANYARTPLVAAMRCYVASRLGEFVDIPEELA